MRLKNYLNEAKGYVVFGTNKKEYLSKFDFDFDYDNISGEYLETKKSASKRKGSGLGWSKDKKNAVIFPDKGSAEIALDKTLTKKFGSVQKV